MNDHESRREERRAERRKRWEDLRDRIHDNRGIYMSRPYMRGSIWSGVLILLIGIAALLKAALVPLPFWVFTWPMLLIALGFFSGIRHRFQGIFWLILMLVGGAFLFNDIYPDMELRRYAWPLVFIVLGIFIIFRRHRWRSDDEKKTTFISGMPVDPIINPEAMNSNEDYVHATSVFGGTKKNILSKNFKGGDIVNVFGGTELNLSQADLQGEAVIELTTIFGGSKLIIPSNWRVKSDAAVIFGGIEDKRSMPAPNESLDKVLVLRGTVIFGGIDIKSF